MRECEALDVPASRAAPLGEAGGTAYAVRASGGLDRVEMRLAAGPREPLRPLHAVASGGESARVMLALKAAPSLSNTHTYTTPTPTPTTLTTSTNTDTTATSPNDSTADRTTTSNEGTESLQVSTHTHSSPIAVPSTPTTQANTNTTTATPAGQAAHTTDAASDGSQSGDVQGMNRDSNLYGPPVSSGPDESVLGRTHSAAEGRLRAAEVLAAGNDSVSGPSAFVTNLRPSESAHVTYISEGATNGNGSAGSDAGPEGVGNAARANNGTSANNDVLTPTESTEPAAPVLVLDELDSSVGSRLGTSVGALLRRMAGAQGRSGATQGAGSQIICVTHLPQVCENALLE